jgi:hypothetical protein
MNSPPVHRAVIVGFSAGLSAFIASLITSDQLGMIVLVAIFAAVLAWLLERMLLPNLARRGPQ